MGSSAYYELNIRNKTKSIVTIATLVIGAKFLNSLVYKYPIIEQAIRIPMDIKYKLI